MSTSVLWFAVALSIRPSVPRSLGSPDCSNSNSANTPVCSAVARAPSSTQGSSSILVVALVVRAVVDAGGATEAGGATATSGVTAGLAWDPSPAKDRLGRANEGISFYPPCWLSLRLFFLGFFGVEESHASEGANSILFWCLKTLESRSTSGCI